MNTTLKFSLKLVTQNICFENFIGGEEYGPICAIVEGKMNENNEWLFMFTPSYTNVFNYSHVFSMF